MRAYMRIHICCAVRLNWVKIV